MCLSTGRLPWLGCLVERHDVCAVAQSRGRAAVVEASAAPCRAKLSRLATIATLPSWDLRLDTMRP
jgi:hypothetical protein